MKKHPILRHFVYAFIFLGMKISSVFVVPFLYNKREEIREKKNIWWYYLNDTTPKDENDIDAGDYGRFEHNYWGFLKQNIWRNAFWNWRLTVIIPKKGIMYNEKGHLGFFNVTKDSKLNDYLYGWGYGTYWIQDEKYFRFSVTKKILFIPVIFHCMFGTNENRYIYKLKIKKV